jgi:hypothetical protein
MLWSRRQAIRTLLATPAGLIADTGLAALAAEPAQGFASYRLQNLGSHPSPAASYHSLGMAFVPGDVPPGFEPALLRADGTRLPVQADLCARWPDGSVRWADIALRHESIEAGAERSLVFAALPKQEADALPADPRSLIEASDLALDLAGLSDEAGTLQGSGQWRFGVNQAFADKARVTLTRNGPVCLEWRLWDAVRDRRDGAPHPHLIGIAYLRAWRAADGSAGPISFCLGLAQGWMGVSAPTRLAYDAVLRNGDQEIRRFTRRVGVESVDAHGRLHAPDHGLATADAVAVEAIGSADDTVERSVYYVRRIDDDRLSLHDSGYDAQNNDRPRALPDIGKSPALVRRIFHHHHSAWLALGPDARLDWLGERPDLHGRHDRAYLHRTGMLPPFDLQQQVDRAHERGRRGYEPAPTYHPFALASARSYTDAPGEHPQIGLLPGWCAAAFLSQDPWQADRARINAVAAAGYPNRFADERSPAQAPFPRPPNVLDRDMPGFASARPGSFYYSARGQSPDIAAPMGGDGGWIPGDTSHYPSPFYYTLLTEGGRHLMDLEINWASYVLLNREAGLRRRRVDRTYYGIVLHNEYNIRADGWALRELSYAAAILPEDDPERAYFKAALHENLAFAMATIDAAPPAFRAGGHWSFRPEAVESPWMQCFIMQAMAMAARQHPDLPEARRFLLHHAIQIRAFADPNPLLGTAYRFLYRKSSDGAGEYLAADAFLYALFGPESDVRVRFTGDGATLEHEPCRIWRLGDGDRLRFTIFNADGQTANTLPAGIADQVFQAVETDGNRFRLLREAGGEPLRWRPAEATDYVTTWWRPRDCPAPQDFVGDPQGRYHILRATLACAAWAGLAGFAQLHARLTEGNATDLSGNPKYAYAP